MKSILSTLLAAFMLAAGTSFATELNHDHHPTTSPILLHLNNGTKWETDATLRKAMSSLRQIMATNLPAIHENRLSAKQYASLAKKVDGVVTNIIGQCKLLPAADEQLHFVIAELFEGSRKMADKTQSDQARAGALKVIDALGDYGQYFNDPSFKPLSVSH